MFLIYMSAMSWLFSGKFGGIKKRRFLIISAFCVFSKWYCRNDLFRLFVFCRVLRRLGSFLLFFRLLVCFLRQFRFYRRNIQQILFESSESHKAEHKGESRSATTQESREHVPYVEAGCESAFLEALFRAALFVYRLCYVAAAGRKVRRRDRSDYECENQNDV